MYSTLNTFQVVGFDVVGILQNEAFAIPNEFCITIMAYHMHMDWLMFMGKEKENKAVLSK